MKSATTISCLIKRKIVTAVLISASLAAFATLGDGVKKAESRTFLSPGRYTFAYKPFSLKTNFNYRGNNILNTSGSERFIMLNTVMTYQKGNSTYILPLKKKVILNRINFNPAR